MTLSWPYVFHIFWNERYELFQSIIKIKLTNFLLIFLLNLHLKVNLLNSRKAPFKVAFKVSSDRKTSKLEARKSNIFDQISNFQAVFGKLLFLGFLSNLDMYMVFWHLTSSFSVRWDFKKRKSRQANAQFLLYKYSRN